MLDIFNFLIAQLGELFIFINSFEIIENLSLFNLIIIILLFRVVLKFLYPSKGGEK